MENLDKSQFIVLLETSLNRRLLSPEQKTLDAAYEDYIDLLHARRRWIAQVDARIAAFDALVMPTVPVVAPPITELQASDAAYAAANALLLRNPTLINFLDGCALSLPCHEPGAAPVGLMLAAAGGQDRALLGLGEAVEQALRQRA